MTKMTSLHLSYFFDAHYEQLQINSEKNSQNSLPKRFMMNVLMNSDSDLEEKMGVEKF